MFFLQKRTQAQLRVILQHQQERGLSYPEVGATREDQHPLPKGYAHDHYRSLLGRGEEVFQRSAAALQQWKMYPSAWTEVSGPWPGFSPGAGFVTQVYHFGFWSINCCEIVYLLDEQTPKRRQGFAIGSLHTHAARGEERFLVEFDPETGQVFFDIWVFSQPQHWLVRLAYPLSRWMQRRFGRQAQASMKAAVQSPTHMT